MKTYIFFCMFLTMRINAVDLQDIIAVHISKVGFFIQSYEAMTKKQKQTEQAVALIPDISLGNNFNYLGLTNTFDSIRLRETLSNTIGLSFMISPGNLYLIHSKEKQNNLVGSTVILSLYADIMLCISEAKNMINDLAFKKEYRKALTDFKQQIAYDEIIAAQKKEIVRTYRDIIKLQLELYAKSGIAISYEKGEYNYTYEIIEKIIQGVL